MLSPKFGGEHEAAGVHEATQRFGGVAIVGACAAARGIRRVGVLTPYTKQYFVDRNDVAAFTNEFQRLGWEEGRNFHLEYRGVAPNEEQLRSAAADLVDLKSEVILVVTSSALRAAQDTTDTIPIVFVGVTDPVNQGFVANLAHPGGNVTGFASFEFSIGSKWLQLLRVRPISSSRITEFSQHEANGCEAQEDQAAEVEIFPVLGKPAATIEPRNGALDDPSARQNDEAFGPIGTPDDFGFELRSDLGQRRMEDRPRIGAVGKEPFQKRKQAEKRGKQQDAAVAILNIGRMNNRVQQQTLCIYQDMPLLALDELARVEPGRIDAGSAFFGAFHTLAVD